MLIGTSDVRIWLNIPDGEKAPNDKLNALCLAIQTFVENYIQRPLEAQVFTTDPNFCYFDGTGTSYLYLPVPPISNVYEVAMDQYRQFGSGTIIGTDTVFFDPEGKLMLQNYRFYRGRRNVRVSYLGGYGAAGSYPLPYDLKQVMVEMVCASYKKGLTEIHQVAQPVARGQAGEVSLMKFLDDNSFWTNTLDSYKKLISINSSYEEGRFGERGNYGYGGAGYDDGRIYN